MCGLFTPACHQQSLMAPNCGIRDQPIPVWQRLKDHNGIDGNGQLLEWPRLCGSVSACCCMVASWEGMPYDCETVFYPSAWSLQ